MYIYVYVDIYIYNTSQRQIDCGDMGGTGHADSLLGLSAALSAAFQPSEMTGKVWLLLPATQRVVEYDGSIRGAFEGPVMY